MVHPSCGDAAIDTAYQRALDYLYDRINYERMSAGTKGYPFRLQRMQCLMERLSLAAYLDQGGRKPPVPLVHIAGTKGKGSAASMVSAALTAAGLKTGLYTSPHLHRLEERFRVDQQSCSRQAVVEAVDRIRPVAEQLAAEPSGALSFFELTTAMALMHFDACQCEAIVLEVGLGGRLDSTNVYAPTVTAITSIGLDHQHVLGDTLSAIAQEKAGILKPGVPVVSGVADGEAAEVIERVARERNCPLYRIGQAFEVEWTMAPGWGSQVVVRGSTPPLQRSCSLELKMEGPHQATNAAVAMAIIDLLRDQGVAIAPQAAAAGLSRLQCPGRIERFQLPQETTVIVDAAHNGDSIRALCSTLQRRWAGRPITVVFGTSRDKLAPPMLSELGKIASGLVLTQFQGNPRYLPVDSLGKLPEVAQVARWEVIADPIEACRRGLQWATPGGVLVICGSFFLAGETREWIEQQAIKS